MGENFWVLVDAPVQLGSLGLGVCVCACACEHPSSPYTHEEGKPECVKGNFYRLFMSPSRALAGSFLPYSRGMHCLGVEQRVEL